MNSRGKARIQVFEDLLDSNEIDVVALRKACFHGIPDRPGVRPLCWKILLGEICSYDSGTRPHARFNVGFSMRVYDRSISRKKRETVDQVSHRDSPAALLTLVE